LYAAEGVTAPAGHSALRVLASAPNLGGAALGESRTGLPRACAEGGGTHPGSGVPTILESGRIAANMLSKRCGVPFASHNKQV